MCGRCLKCKEDFITSVFRNEQSLDLILTLNSKLQSNANETQDTAG